MFGRIDENPFAVCGLGNVLMGDDGVGVHVVRKLQEKRIEDVTCIETGTAVLNSLDDIAGKESVILVDALQNDLAPGTVSLVSGSNLQSNYNGNSIHTLGLIQALHFLTEDEWPRNVVMVGIEPANISYSMSLTPPAEEATDLAVRVVMRMIIDLKNGTIPDEHYLRLSRLSLREDKNKEYLQCF